MLCYISNHNKEVAVKKCSVMIVVCIGLLLQGCTWDFVGPCHRATLLRKDAEHASGFKRAELLGKADGLQGECDRETQRMYDRQRPGH
jgi:hypothetical protein